MSLYAELRANWSRLPVDLYEPVLIGSLALNLTTRNYVGAVSTLNDIRLAAHKGHMTKSLRRIIRGVRTLSQGFDKVNGSDE